MLSLNSVAVAASTAAKHSQPVSIRTSTWRRLPKKTDTTGGRPSSCESEGDKRAILERATTVSLESRGGSESGDGVSRVRRVLSAFPAGGLGGVALILAGPVHSLLGSVTAALGTMAFLAAASVGSKGAISSFSTRLEIKGAISFPLLVSSSPMSTFFFSSVKVLALSGSCRSLAGRLVCEMGTRLFPSSILF